MRLRYEEMQKAAKEMEKQPARQPVGTYVKKEQRYEDMNSSASAFFLVGGVLALIAAVSLLGYLNGKPEILPWAEPPASRVLCAAFA